MTKKTKILLCIAACLIVSGVIIFACVMTVNHWDFTKLSTEKIIENTYEITEDFTDIKINTDTADIVFKKSENGICKVVSGEYENLKSIVETKEKTLVISSVDKRKWYEHISINFATPKTVIYLPKAEYNRLTIKEDTGDIFIPDKFKFTNADISVSTGNVEFLSSVLKDAKIHTTTGNIKAENITANTLDLSVSTGETTLTSIKCKKLLSKGSTGDIFIKNLIAENKISIKRSTGNVKLDGIDSKEIAVKTNTGDIKGTVLSNKVFTAKTDTGYIKIPKSSGNENCKLTTDTGNIFIDYK